MQFKVEGCGSQCGFVVGMLTITGNHGTDDRNVPQILKSGFIPSKGRNHWYGEGVYFFIEGINIKSIDVLAEQWARNQSYDKKTKRHEVVISNTYIKFDDDRRTNIKSFIPNCTVMSVLDECRIDRKSIKLIRKGEI